jgi:hypothetical protein
MTALIHDIVSGLETRVGGIRRFRQEIKGWYQSQEFVRGWQQGGFGIGLIRVP